MITLKTIEWSKITKIARTHRNLIVHKTLTINDKILVKLFKCGKFNSIFCVVVNVLRHVEVMFTQSLQFIDCPDTWNRLAQSLQFKITQSLQFINCLDTLGCIALGLQKIQCSNKHVMEEIVRQVGHLPELKKINNFIHGEKR